MYIVHMPTYINICIIYMLYIVDIIVYHKLAAVCRGFVELTLNPKL